MELVEVTNEEYSRVISPPYHIFNGAEFNNLNANKCETVYYWLFKEGKYRLGLIAGKKNNLLVSPYSAPYGGFSYIAGDISIEYLESAIEEVIIKGRELGVTAISITLPPNYFNESFISKMLNCLFRKKFAINSIDLDYAISLVNINDFYLSSIWRNARKNLQISLLKNLEFKRCDNISDKYRAYEVIEYNREKKGYPLRMKWEEVLETSRVIPVDYFLISNSNRDDIGAGIVFQVKDKEIAQVIYWGDKPEYSENKTMNYLSYNIFKHYKNEGFKYLDIGPSTEYSMPNYGLCEFKESIGCFISPKITMINRF